MRDTAKLTQRCTCQDPCDVAIYPNMQSVKPEEAICLVQKDAPWVVRDDGRPIFGNRDEIRSYAEGSVKAIVSS